MKYVCEKTGKQFDDEFDAELSETAYCCRVRGIPVAVDSWTILPDSVSHFPIAPESVKLDLRGWGNTELKDLLAPYVEPCDCAPWPLPFVFGGILGCILSLVLTIWVLGI